MLRVAICDDSALERDILADFLSHYCNAHAIDYFCKMYDSGEPLYYEHCVVKLLEKHLLFRLMVF